MDAVVAGGVGVVLVVVVVVVGEVGAGNRNAVQVGRARDMEGAVEGKTPTRGGPVGVGAMGGGGVVEEGLLSGGGLGEEAESDNLSEFLFSWSVDGNGGTAVIFLQAV